MNDPLVTVLMSVYNGEKYLSEAIESILNQTYKNFEFLIINDGSTDKTMEILQSYHDSRIKIIDNKNNIGLTKSLNKGLSMAKGEYIARMDADDISLPERLERQVQYMDVHPDIGVFGTWIKYIDENGTPQGDWRMITSPGLIGWHLFFGTCLAHPSVIMRRDVVEQVGFYCSEALCAQDYDLWIRISAITKLANIPEILLQRRVVEDGICSRHFQTQEQNVINAMHLIISQCLGFEVDVEVVISLRQLVLSSSLDSLIQIERVADLIQKLYRTYLRANCLNRIEVKEVTYDAGRKLCALTLSASKISLWKGLVIFFQALRLNPQVIFLRIITKSLGILLGRS